MRRSFKTLERMPTQIVGMTAQARGFSLIEIMIVLTLIALIVSAIGVGVLRQFGTGQESTARSQAYEIAKNFDLYRLEFGKYPTQSEGFQALLNPPRGEPLLDRMPVDPWGNEFVYRYPGVKNRNKPDVYSKGKDPDKGQEIGNWPVDE